MEGVIKSTDFFPQLWGRCRSWPRSAGVHCRQRENAVVNGSQGEETHAGYWPVDDELVVEEGGVLVLGRVDELALGHLEAPLNLDSLIGVGGATREEERHSVGLVSGTGVGRWRGSTPPTPTVMSPWPASFRSRRCSRCRASRSPCTVSRVKSS